jgi:hypothetical protein
MLWPRMAAKTHASGLKPARGMLMAGWVGPVKERDTGAQMGEFG